MEVLSTGATSTVTTCSPSGLSAAFSAVQPDKSDTKHNKPMILKIKLCIIFRTVLSPSAMSRARHDIESAHRRRRCAPERGYSAHRPPPVLWIRRPGSADYQAQALCCIIRSAPEAIDCRARRQGLVVKQIKVAEQLPLHLRQLHARLLFPQLRLDDFTAPYTPVENRQGEVADNKISQVRHRAGLCKRRNCAVQRERIRLDAIVPIDRQRRKQGIPCDADILSCQTNGFLGDAYV